MSHNITIGKLRGGFCVSWKDPASRKRRRYQLEARSRKDAEPEAVEVYRRETFRANPAGSRLDEIWQAYIEDLGDRPTATTMGYTGKAILPHFGGYLPQDIDKTMCLRYRQMREEAGKSVGTVWTELGHLQSALNLAQHEHV